MAECSMDAPDCGPSLTLPRISSILEAIFRLDTHMAFSLRFDTQDVVFLSQVKRAIELNRAEHAAVFPHTDALHPNGIIDLAIPAEMRMASAVLRLLDSLEQGQEEERIHALRALREEVMVSARTNLRRNTGRVLIQIMKEIVRAQGDDERQLRLAHDFRQAASGKPAVIRRMLRRYFLLEMPEEWNQAVFDHHVHDANTKGRKNATHLIMDAWVKGIRSLTVIYYHFVRPEAARELMEAAEIMGVTVRIGLLFHAPYRGGLIDFIWIPRGFSDAEGFLAFLAEPGVRRLMEKGREASAWMERHILSMLDLWNSRGRHELERELGIVTEELDREKFLAFVGAGQTFLLHLAEFIHASLLSSLREEAAALSERLESPGCDDACRAMLEKRLHRLDGCTTEYLMEVLRRPVFRSEREKLTRAPVPGECGGDCPELLRTPPLLLLDWLSGLHSGNRVVLNLARLSPEDVLNLLWDCQGFITIWKFSTSRTGRKARSRIWRKSARFSRPSTTAAPLCSSSSSAACSVTAEKARTWLLPGRSRPAARRELKNSGLSCAIFPFSRAFTQRQSSIRGWAPTLPAAPECGTAWAWPFRRRFPTGPDANSVRAGAPVCGCPCASRCRNASSGKAFPERNARLFPSGCCARFPDCAIFSGVRSVNGFMATPLSATADSAARTARNPEISSLSAAWAAR